MSNLNVFLGYTPGQHAVTNIPFKAHKIPAFSPEPLEQHFEQCYGGAIRRLNEIELELVTTDQECQDELMHGQLKVANLIILLETYFKSIGEEGGLALSDNTLKRALESSFGSVEKWREEFSELAKLENTTWVVLAWSEHLNRLVNLRSTGNLLPLLAAKPLLAIDLCSSVYSNDFGSDLSAYIAAFVGCLNWCSAEDRFQQFIGSSAVNVGIDPQAQISVVELKSRVDSGEELVVLDVRHDDDRERYRSRIMESDFRDSFHVSAWADQLPKDKSIVVYCMYGFWVSMEAAVELRELGYDARSLSGGVVSWNAMGYAISENQFA